jgi:hypothetical protein
VIEKSKDGKVYYLEDHLGDQLQYPVSILRLAPWRDRDAELVDANLSKAKRKTKSFQEDNLIEPASMPLDSDSDENSQEGLDVVMDLGDEEYIPSQSTAIIVKAKSGHSTNDIPVMLPSEDVTVVDNDKEVPLQRTTCRTRAPRPVVTAQPHIGTTQKGRKKRRTRLDC